MKRNNTQMRAMAYLVVGLLLTTLMPMANRYLLLPNVLKGFITGLGLTLEFIGLVKMKRNKHCANLYNRLK